MLCRLGSKVVFIGTMLRLAWVLPYLTVNRAPTTIANKNGGCNILQLVDSGLFPTRLVLGPSITGRDSFSRSEAA